MLNETIASKIKWAVVPAILAVIAIGCGSSPDADGWRTSTIRENGSVDGCPIGTVLVGEPKEKDGQVLIRMVDTLCEDKECRVVAVDREGQIQFGERTVKLSFGGKPRSTEVVFSGMKLEDIKEFKFQSRPCRQKAVRVSRQVPPAASTVKTRLIDAAGKGDLFTSNYFN